MSTTTYGYPGTGFDDDLDEPSGNRRRWPGTVLALLLVLCGAGGAVWFGQADRAHVEVVVLTRPMTRGDVVTAGDLAVVRMAAEGGTVRVTTPQLAQQHVVGRQLLLDLPAGTVLAPEMVGETTPPAGFATVGARVPAEGLPGPSPRAGERVDVLGVDPATGQARVLVRDAEVSAVAAPEAGGGAAGGTVVYLVVPDGAAAEVVTAAASDGGVRLVGPGSRP